jgi:starch synthase
MTPPEGLGAHYHTTITLPKDAYKMDFVFSDVEQGEGTYDNRCARGWSLMT